MFTENLLRPFLTTQTNDCVFRAVLKLFKVGCSFPSFYDTIVSFEGLYQSFWQLLNEIYPATYPGF